MRKIAAAIILTAAVSSALAQADKPVPQENFRGVKMTPAGALDLENKSLRMANNYLVVYGRADALYNEAVSEDKSRSGRADQKGTCRKS
ncbi:hypothetical protein [Edaphobacter flagellatus]|uniref:hypothetical protein n=1 Tax=Edaphobacter flagellatus TaxID=1933044 RepID=UPI0021B44DA1|nr:hypothetical protein [Edaphobacter flagellatus]